MKIALISPKGSFLGENYAFREFCEKSKELYFYKRFWSGLSSGLLIIAGLTPKEIKIELIDENVESINFDKDYDLVALSAMTQQATRAYEIADEFRKKKVKVVMGGIHATVLPKEAKEHCDSVFIGEAEETWPQFISDFLNNRISPFYLSKGSVDLEKSPMPRYDLLKSEKYNIIWIQTTRGCPFDCEFCSASKIFGAKYRHKTIEQVVREVKFVESISKSSHIGFADDNMFVNRKYATELAKKLIPLKIRWMTQTDISIAEDEKLLKLLKKSGCYILFIGFESLSEKNLISVDKSGFKARKLSKYSEYIKKIQSYGIGVMGAFILGFDYDDNSVFKRTADFIIDNYLYTVQITTLTPFPGTRLRMRLEQENRLLDFNWNHYTLWDVNFVPKQMSVEELQLGLLETHKAIYNDVERLKRIKYFKDIVDKLVVKT